MDTRSEHFISTLDAPTQEKAREFMEKCKDAMLPYTVKIISGTRTYDEQNILYAFGRSRPGKIRTNARGGQSWHNFARAWDIGVFNDLDQYVDDLVDRREMKQSDVDSLYTAAGEIAESLGIEWAGRWKTFNENCHFQWNPQKLTLAQMREAFEKNNKIG